MAEAGYVVYAGSRTPSKLEALHTNLYPIKLDLTDATQIQESVADIYAKHGALDIVINNAGYGFISSVEDASEEDMKKQFDINVFSVFRVCKAAIPYMKENKEGAIIINIGSYFGKISLPLFAFYSASKFAVEGLTDALRYELKDLNIRVHSVTPGFTNTSFTDQNLVENDYTFSYEKSGVTTPQLMENINKGSDPKVVALNVLQTIQDSDAKMRVYVEGEAHKITPLKEELSDDEYMMYRFYKLEVSDEHIEKEDLSIAMDAKEILLVDFVNPPNLEQLAIRCASNKTKLNIVFQKVYKTTIANYIKKLRLEKAKLLLQEERMSVAEVAKKVGYAHQGNFSKLFFQKYGVHPKMLK